MINIKIFNIKTRKEIEGIVGLVTTIKRKENKLLITTYYFNEEKSLEKKKIIYTNKIGLEFNTGDLIIGSKDTLYFYYKGLLIPLRGKDKTAYKISTKSKKELLTEQSNILYALINKKRTQHKICT